MWDCEVGREVSHETGNIHEGGHLAHLTVAPGTSWWTVKKNTLMKAMCLSQQGDLVTQTVFWWWGHGSTWPNHIFSFGAWPKLIRISDLTLAGTFSEKEENELTKSTLWPQPPHGAQSLQVSTFVIYESEALWCRDGSWLPPQHLLYHNKNSHSPHKLCYFILFI